MLLVNLHAAAGECVCCFCRACDVTFTDACVAKRGYDVCRKEKVEQHLSGVSNTYDSRTPLVALLISGDCTDEGGTHEEASTPESRSAAIIFDTCASPVTFCLCDVVDCEGPPCGNTWRTCDPVAVC